MFVLHKRGALGGMSCLAAAWQAWRAGRVRGRIAQGRWRAGRRERRAAGAGAGAVPGRPVPSAGRCAALPPLADHGPAALGVHLPQGAGPQATLSAVRSPRRQAAGAVVRLKLRGRELTAPLASISTPPQRAYAGSSGIRHEPG